MIRDDYADDFVVTARTKLIRDDYADDFVVTARTKETLKPALLAFLAQRGLELSEQKTTITRIQGPTSGSPEPVYSRRPDWTQ